MRSPRNNAGILAGMAISYFLAAPAHAQMYKCVDAKGVTQYADKPCPGGKAVDIRAQPPISGKLETHGTDIKDAERDFFKRQLERDRAEKKDAEAAAAAVQRKQQCAQLKADHERWLSIGRIRIVDAKGERRYMDDNERLAKIAQMEAAIARYCS